MLNKIRTASLKECDETILKSRFLSQNDDNYPYDDLHNFAENKPCQEHDSNMLKSNENVLCSIPAIDALPKNVSQNVIEKVLNRNQSETGDLARKQHQWVPIEKAEASIMIRANKDILPVSKRTQFPLMLAWACTVHKVQGLRLDKAETKKPFTMVKCM